MPRALLSLTIISSPTSEPVAVEFDPNVKRVTCVRQLTTNNQIISFALAADGQNAVTTRYSVQPATDGGVHRLNSKCTLSLGLVNETPAQHLDRRS
jgi:hypothetical protein